MVEIDMKELMTQLRMSVLMSQLCQAFDRFCHPSEVNPFFIVGIEIKDGRKKIITANTDINSNPWQESPNITYIGTVKVNELKPGDVDRILADYGKKIGELLGSSVVE